VLVEADGLPVAASERAVRICETAGAPVVYVPPQDVDSALLAPSSHRTLCEWKGAARYYDLRLPGRTIERAAWSYPQPNERYASIAGWISFYPRLVDCRLDGEPVRPQPGGFYGGWVTAEIRGPLKGEPGTEGW
jgi:uncharacterized protein (DUF427 family)